MMEEKSLSVPSWTMLNVDDVDVYVLLQAKPWSKQEHEPSTPWLGNLMQFGIFVWSATGPIRVSQCRNIGEETRANLPAKLVPGPLQFHEHLSDLSAIYIRCWLNVSRQMLLHDKS